MRENAIEALGQLGDVAIEPLIEALRDADGPVRQEAARALGQRGDPRAVEPLIEALRDADEEVGPIAHPAPPFLEPAAHIQFTAYHPKEVRPETWYALLAYVHLPEALVAVQSDSRTRLGPEAGNAGRGRSQATQTTARGAEMVVVPELPGCRFNPPRASFLWLEDWHRAEFRMQATPDLPDSALGQAVNGRVAFYVGPVLVADGPHLGARPSGGRRVGCCPA